MSFYYLLYNLLFIFALFLGLPYFLFKCKPSSLKIKQRLGKNLDKYPRMERCIWFHCASLGEVLTAFPVISKVKNRFPKKRIILSVNTDTGYKIALEKKSLDFIFYFPLDIYPIVKKTIKSINPSMIIIMETELWPNFLLVSHKMKIPVILANGRISEKSKKRYLILPKRFRREVFSKFTLFCMQTESDYKKIISLGADSEKVKICGNTKFDQISLNYSLEEEDLKKRLKLSQKDKIITAGSTHRGEEELIIEVFLSLRERFKDLRLIIAPRHIERVKEIENLLKFKDIRYFKRTEEPLKEAEILILDTIGELRKFYSLSYIVIIGGSFVPVGGHNIIEPAIYRKPIIFGPFMENFKEIKEIFLGEKACLQVKDKETLAYTLIDLIQDKKKAEKLGENAYQVFLKNKGASKKILEEIEDFVR